MPNVCINYRLDFASGAWSQFGLLERPLFQLLTDKLRTVAAEAPRLAGALPDASPWLVDRARVDCGDYAAFYEIDHRTCTVLVIELVASGLASTAR